MVVSLEGVASPGLKVRLRADGPKDAGLKYRWMQTSGPAVAIEDPTDPTIEFAVPDGAGSLAFLLVFSGPEGIEATSVTVPVEGKGRSAATPARLRADAGDDQLGFVGRQVTLNGIRSAPRGAIGYRWIQVGGPPVLLKLEDGYVFTYVPNEPGLYRFALVVATGGEISEPDIVDVTVPASRVPASTAGLPPTQPTDELARAALASLPGGTAAAGRLAETFSAVATRVDLYESYAGLYSELSRRLEEIVPPDPASRGAWAQGLFAPLTIRLIEQMRLEGLDLLAPQGQEKTMNSGQKERLAGQLRAMADGFRELNHAR